MKKRIILGSAIWFIIWILVMPQGLRGSEKVNVQINLKNISGSNIPNLLACSVGETFVFKCDAVSPTGASFYFVTYEFSIQKSGLYRVVIQGPGSGTRTCSRYSLSIDNGPEKNALTKRLVTLEKQDLMIHEQEPVALDTGRHTLELRFHPEQRMRQMNRVTEPFVGHCAKIEGIYIEEVSVPSISSISSREADQKLLLKNGDRIVLFGDSITEEGFYAQHFVRLLQKGYASEQFFVYNSGISLNRTWEGIERLNRDVIALRPQWVILAYGVNDAVHMAPDEFIKNYRIIVTRLKQAGIRVLCATPSGMISEPDERGNYFHTPDRARAFDATMAMEAAGIIDLAKELDCLSADVFGAFVGSGLNRKTLMASQWHPGDEGGRIFALSLLYALGFSEKDIARSLDKRDADAFTAIATMTPISHPRYKPPVNLPIAPSHQRRLLAASSYAQNYVAAFLEENGELLGTAQVGTHPMGMVYSQKRKELYVACEGSGQIQIISLPRFESVGVIKLGDVYPVSVALSPDQNRLWTANFFGSSVCEIDLASRKICRTFPLGALGEAIILSPDARFLIVAMRKQIGWVDIEKGRVVHKANASDYASAFFVDAESQIGVLDTASWNCFPVDLTARDLRSPVPAPFPARALICDLKTRDLWAGDCERHEIVRISASRGEKRKIAEIQFPFGLTLIDP